MANKTYYAEIVCEVIGVDSKDFADEMAQIARALYALEGAAGASIAGDPIARTVTFDIVVPAANEKAAISRANSIARTALHAIGGATHDWPTTSWPEDFPPVSHSVTQRKMVAAH